MNPSRCVSRRTWNNLWNQIEVIFNFVLLLFFHVFEPIVWSGWGHQSYAKAERPLQGGCGLQQSAKPDKFMQEARPNWLKRTQGICIMHTCHLIKYLHTVVFQLLTRNKDFCLCTYTFNYSFTVPNNTYSFFWADFYSTQMVIHWHPWILIQNSMPT